MPRKQLEVPPAVARAFVEDMKAFFAEKNAIKRDEIAARQLYALKQHYTGKLRLFDVKEMFLITSDAAASAQPQQGRDAESRTNSNPADHCERVFVS
jgi:hypothetical protein